MIASAAYDETALDTAGGYVFGRRFAGEAPDNSPFAVELLAALAGQADVNPPAHAGMPEGDGLITATELLAWVAPRVQGEASAANHRQRPGLWTLPNHQGGEYVFRNPERPLALEDAPPPTNPYRGLSSYDEIDSHLFFGRAQQIEALADLVGRTPFVAVLGASGAGKSSLAKAGLIPALGGSHRAGAPADPRPARDADWLVLPAFRPGAEPVAGLEKLLVDHLPGCVTQAPPLASHTGGLAAVVAAWAADHRGGRLVLVIDQFEELVTLCGDGAQRAHFQALLREGLAAGGDALRVVVTLRTDFEPQFNRGPLAGYWLREARYVVPPMSQENFRQVILGPAWASELYFEPYALVDELINEVVQAPGGLPLLSVALSEMYRRYAESGRQDRTLRREDFDAVGGVIGSLRTSANRIWDELDAAHQATMQRLMLRMVALEGGQVARRRVAWVELDYGEEENARRDAVIGRLEEARLVVWDKAAGWVEPAHDALVSGWDRLMAWKLEAASDLPLQRELAPVALRWQGAESAARSGLLWDDNPQLSRLENTLWPVAGKQGGPVGWVRWLKQILWPDVTLPRDTQWLNAPEVRFVQASVARRAATLKLVVGITALVILALGGLALFAGYQAKQASSQRDSAVSAEATAVAEVIVRQTAEANAVSESNARAAEVIVRKTAEAIAQRSAQAEATAAAHARQKQAEAEREARRANAGALAARAQAEIRTDNNANDSALLLARAALLTTLRGDGYYTRDAVEALDLARDNVHWQRTYLPKGIRPRGSVMTVAYSPDGARIVSGSYDNTLIMWDAATLAPVQTLQGHSGGVRSVAWSPDGARIVSGSDDDTLIVWDARMLAPVRTLQGHRGSVASVAWSPDGARIVAGSWDGTLMVWDATTLAPVQTLRGHRRGVTSVAWSPDGKRIVSGSHDSTLIVWDATTQAPVQTLQGHKDWVASVAWSPDGQRIVSGSADKTLKVWPATERVLAMVEGQILRPSWVFTEQERIDYSISDALADWLAAIPPVPTLAPTPIRSPAEIPAMAPAPSATATATPTVTPAPPWWLATIRDLLTLDPTPTGSPTALTPTASTPTPTVSRD